MNSNNDTGQYIRERGHEYGTTTGRPRRCGWFDAVAARYAVRLSGISQVAVMHLDTLTGLDRVGICTGYTTPAGPLPGFISDSDLLATAQPVIEFMPGWKDDPRNARSFGELPGEAQDYVKRIEALMGAAITIVSVGPDRAHTLLRSV